MTQGDNRRGSLPIDDSRDATYTDSQLSACANEAISDDRLPPESSRTRSTESCPPSQPEGLLIGQLLSGRYRIERELGEGGMGTVYLAADEQVSGEQFAIKVVKNAHDPESLEHLREEVRKTRKLSHPNIVDVHSVNIDGQTLYLLMEYLEGKSLDVLLQEEFGRGMSFSHAWPIIEDIGAALGNAHNHNVIHSDLKPANIFVTTSGRTKLLDFGIARISRRAYLNKASAPGALTPAYASCEMLEGNDADRRDDIYSFACVIYELLSGERPYGNLTALEARDSHASIQPIQRISSKQNAALRRALELKREGRTDSVDVFLDGLRATADVRQNPIGTVIAFALAAIVGVALTIVYVNKWEGSRQSSPATEATSVISPPKNSIAVLPFVNISGDAKQEYFSDGLSEELIDHLVHNTQLKVIARTSSFEFKGKTGDVRAIAKILSVSHLLEGSVRTEGQQLRITAQLVRGSDGVQIWSQTYNRDLGGIFKIQDEISERVAEALKATLRDNHATISRETDLRAYNLVLEGNYLKGRRNLVDAGRAVELYQEALKIDPTYALAWARLASAFLVEEILRGQPSEEQNKLVVDALNHAIAIDPNLEWAYYTRAGFQGSIMWDWPAALADTERVRNIDPRFAYLPSAFGDIELAFGEINKAVEFYRDGLARSPLDPNMLNTMGAALCAAGRITECLQVRLTLLQLYPEFGGVNRSIGMTYMYLGRLDEALKSMQAEPDMDLKLSGLSLIFWAMGRHSDSYAALESLTARSGATIPYNIATAHAFRGEVEDAFNWLEKAYRAHDYGMLSLNSDPLLASLRNDPRFHQLLIRMRLYKDVGQSVSRDAKTRDASTYASMPRL